MSSTPADLTLRTAKLTALSCSLIAVVYTVLEQEPSPLVQLFVLFGPFVAVLLWIQKDAQRNAPTRIHDVGFLMWIALSLAWPIVLPWYVFTTRGRAGWRLLLLLVTLMCSVFLTTWLVVWVPFGVRYVIWYWRHGS